MATSAPFPPPGIACHPERRGAAPESKDLWRSGQAIRHARDPSTPRPAGVPLRMTSVRRCLRSDVGAPAWCPDRPIAPCPTHTSWRVGNHDSRPGTMGPEWCGCGPLLPPSAHAPVATSTMGTWVRIGDRSARRCGETRAVTPVRETMGPARRADVWRTRPSPGRNLRRSGELGRGTWRSPGAVDVGKSQILYPGSIPRQPGEQPGSVASSASRPLPHGESCCTMIYVYMHVFRSRP